MRACISRGFSVLVKQLPVGEFLANAYIVGPEAGEEAMIIDPGAEPERVIAAVEDRRVEKIVLTHGHYDHIAALKEVAERFSGAEIIAGAAELALLDDPLTNLSGFMGNPIRVTEVARAVKEGDEIPLGPLVFKVLDTPGHTAGSICLYLNDDGTGKPAVFTGDTLFPGSVGRTDFPGGSMDALMSAIRAKLLPLPDDCVVYSGHGEPTTIAHEKKSNPFLL